MTDSFTPPEDWTGDPEGAALAVRRARNETYRAHQRLEAFELVFAAFEELRRSEYIPHGYSPQWRERAERAEAALATQVPSPTPTPDRVAEVISDALLYAPWETWRGTSHERAMLRVAHAVLALLNPEGRETGEWKPDPLTLRWAADHLPRGQYVCNGINFLMTDSNDWLKREADRIEESR